MIIVGIDPSLNSTAITIYKNGQYSLFNYTNKKPGYKWIKEIDNRVGFKFHEYGDTEDFSDSETEKLKVYDIVTTNIVEEINNIVDEQTYIVIEGYSYSARAGRLIDLVTFSTLLRVKLIKNERINLIVIPPSSLKLAIAMMIYQPDKKKIYRNENGKAGGSFDKKDMMNCLIKLDIKSEYLDYVKINKDLLLKPKDIPKPFDDLSDSMLLCYYGVCLKNKEKD